jgi:hypothetical protein
MMASSIHGMRRAGLAALATLGGAIVEGVVDMVFECVYALVELKKTARYAAPGLTRFMRA